MNQIESESSDESGTSAPLQTSVPVHNAQFVQYLYLATEQAGTYLKSGPVCHHLTYINPTLFSCEIDIENSILVSFKL